MKDLLIYVSAPYRGVGSHEIMRNIELACKAGARIVEAGHTPAIPHALTYMMYGFETKHLDEPITRFNNRLLEACDTMVVIGPRISAGMHIEMLHAAKLGIPFYKAETLGSLRRVLIQIHGKGKKARSS